MEMHPEIAAVLRPEERMVWSGRPRQGLRFHWVDETGPSAAGGWIDNGGSVLEFTDAVSSDGVRHAFQTLVVA